jgi:hypothetical protein
MELSSIAALALGLVFVGSGDGDVAGSLIEGFIGRTETDLNDSSARLMCLGLGLIFLGQGEKVGVTLTMIEVVDHPLKKFLEATLNACAHAGSNSVLEVQKLLAVLADHMDDDEKVGFKAGFTFIFVSVFPSSFLNFFFFLKLPFFLAIFLHFTPALILFLFLLFIL